MKRFILLIAALISLAFTAQGQPEALFEKAAEAYNAGEYETAASLYENILDQDLHSAALYYNLGNCYYKLNKIAPSIYYYEKALLLDPGDKEIENNLAFARNMTLDAIEELPETDLNRAYNQLTGILSFDQWAQLSILMVIGFVIAISLYFYFRFPKPKRLAFTFGMFALAISLVAILFAYFQYTIYLEEQPAIIFAEETTVRSEPNNRSEQAFLLHEGTKVNILEELNDWKKIELKNGQSGWLLAEDLRALKSF